MVYHDLEKTHLILNLLKEYKIINRDKLAKEADTNTTYVTGAINYLRSKGYVIDTNLGYEGCYEYKYKRKVRTDKKLDKIQVKGIKKLYKKGVRIDEIENIVNTTRGSVFYHLHKQHVKLNRRKLEINEERRKKL